MGIVAAFILIILLAIALDSICDGAMERNDYCNTVAIIVTVLSSIIAVEGFVR